MTIKGKGRVLTYLLAGNSAKAVVNSPLREQPGRKRPKRKS